MVVQQTPKKSLTVSILSLSFLTVMAGAAVAPALGVIQEHFADSSQMLVQMIISIPAIFIVITNSIFPRLCKRFGAKTLTMIGLLLYTAGGCIAGAFSQILLVLIMRAFVGVGVGIIMPLSTGLLFSTGKAGKADGIFFCNEPDGWRGGDPAFRCSGNHQLAAQFPCVSHGAFQHNTLRDLRAQ